MSNPLEAYTERIIAFQDQFLSTPSEGTHWYLGDNFKEASLILGHQLAGGTAESENPTLPEGQQMETAYYLLVQGPNITETKAVYRLPLDSKKREIIMKELTDELNVFKKYGLQPDLALQIENDLEKLLNRLMLRGFPLL